ncbi:MAG: hypothetical protein IPL99_11600 [Candidatus Competibacteraceae bacterium]|nr:hypothetical protein [Candidatus Competibacteraceae bacterium]
MADTAKGYEARGYAKYMQVGDPPVYAMLGRGHEEVHIFQPQDPTASGHGWRMIGWR